MVFDEMPESSEQNYTQTYEEAKSSSYHYSENFEKF